MTTGAAGRVRAGKSGEKMAAGDTNFETFLADEVKKVKGIYVPVRAGFLECLLHTRSHWKHLHPNPDDEFCDPKVGPSYRIISDYQDNIIKARQHNIAPIAEPIIVEKIRPEGYLLLNGHHRWAAAIRMGLKKVPIKIVNLTQEIDIRKVIENSKHDKRVTFDLDEVVFRDRSDKLTEKPLHFIAGRVYKERLRLGIPSLFRYLSKSGYDIWVYSARYYSLDSIKYLLHRYHAHVDGIVTGTERNTRFGAEFRLQQEKMMTDKYPVTVHIDNESVTMIDARSKKYRTIELPDKADEWSGNVINAIKELEKTEL